MHRMGGAQKLLTPKKKLSKEGRGSLDYRIINANSGIMVLSWLDNGVVNLVTSFLGPSLCKP